MMTIAFSCFAFSTLQLKFNECIFFNKKNENVLFLVCNQIDYFANIIILLFFSFNLLP